MKARFTEKPDAVQIVYDGNTVYCQIAINIEEVEVTDEDGSTHMEYEADFNHFSCQKGTIDVEDIKRNPPSYINYVPNAESEIEKRINSAVASAVASLI